MRRGGGRTKCAQPIHRTSSSSSPPSDEYGTPPSSARDVTPPPARRTHRGVTTRRKTTMDDGPPASLGQQEPMAPANAPAAGGIVRRMRWSHNMNESVMRAYYGATEGGTNLTAYRARMLSLFQQ